MVTCRVKDPVTGLYKTGIQVDVLGKSDSIIGFTYVLENKLEKWVALAIRIRPDDVDLTCSIVVPYGDGHRARYPKQAIAIMKGDVPYE